jgi:hypothetical protein
MLSQVVMVYTKKSFPSRSDFSFCFMVLGEEQLMQNLQQALTQTQQN